jgi:hypothetical protein
MKRPRLKDYIYSSKLADEGCIMWEEYARALEAYIEADKEPRTFVEVQFPSIRKEGKNYTLDGKQQISNHVYSKNIPRTLIGMVQSGGYYGWEDIITCTAEEWVIKNTVKL